MERKGYKKLKVWGKAHQLAMDIYKISKTFPKEEVYGLTSQIRRATLSVALNYVEGYARRKPAVRLNFLEISYGSLKESEYLLKFTKEEKFLDEEDYNFGQKISDEIGAMLWTEMSLLDKTLNQ